MGKILVTVMGFGCTFGNSPPRKLMVKENDQKVSCVVSEDKWVFRTFLAKCNLRITTVLSLLNFFSSFQARIAEAPPEEQAKLIPSRELEEKRKAYVR